MSKRYTEGIAFDGAAILDNGKPITITEILDRLNKLNELEQCNIANVVGQSEQFTAEQVVRQLNEEEHLDDAIMYYKQKIQP